MIKTISCFFSALKRNPSSLLLIGLIFISSFLQAQNTNNEQIKRLQRAIYIFNFAQQVNWENQNNLKEFKIGVLGNDRTVIDLNALSQKRKILNKPVKIVNFNTVKEIENIQILYVNNRYNFDIEYLLSKISNKNILLITEDYKYNDSMINIVSVEDSFEYEINKSILNKEGFEIAPTLETYAVSSAQKWKLLYKETQKNLNSVKTTQSEQKELLDNKTEELKQQNTVIQNQNLAIDTISSKLGSKEKWIKELQKDNAFKDKKIEDIANIKIELEQLIKLQLDSIQAQENKLINQQQALSNSKKNIELQNKTLDNQNIEIAYKKEVIKENNSQINKLKLFNYLLAALVITALIAAIVIYNNYRQKKKLNKILKEKNKLISAQNKELEQFAYITSHDLKEPLNTISGLIGLLLEDYHNQLDEDGQTTLNYINESSVRMRELIDALLEYSRLGKTKSYTEVDITETIKNVQKDLSRFIVNSKAKITVNNMPIITGSKIELRLLFQNLINNGIKFIAAGTTPQIQITSSKVTLNNTLFWQFEIKDNGIGISQDHQERIFAIFQRLHSREDYDGTGIGLAHCKKIVEAHGGKIWLESELKKGSTFYFTIPVTNTTNN